MPEAHAIPQSATRALPRQARLTAALMAALVATSLAMSWQSAAAQVHVCGEIGPTRGDYISDRRLLKTVEDYHFTPRVENLIRGQSGAYIGSDLAYTLRSFPNHHRALMTLMRLAERERTPQPQGAEFSVECYFDRALRFRPDDAVARMLLSTYLMKQRRLDDAKAQLERTAHEAGDSPMTHFNIGLIYLEMKDYDGALRHAHQAAALGLARTELKDALVKAGRWQEPAPEQPSHEQAAGAPVTSASSPR